jgi:trans-aconitate methyltransferase
MMVNDYWKSEDYALHARYVSQLSEEVMRDLAPQRGEQILDLGCGDGVLAEVLMGLGCDVVGIDSSASLVEAARGRGVEVRLGDAQAIEDDAAFDAIFSNAALHWMLEQTALSQRVFRALKPGGRFVAEMGGTGNIAQIRAAMTGALAEIGIAFADRNPWTFPTPEEHRALLEKIGFRVTKCALRDRPTLLPTDVHGWFATFSQGILSDLDLDRREAVIDRMVELCRPELCDAAGKWTVDYVRLNFVAEKPALSEI